MTHRLIALLLALLVGVLPSIAAPASITGTVTYRERVALPPGANLRLTLVEFPANTPVIGASAELMLPGQPPFAFTFTLRSPVPEGEYGVVAEIVSGSRLLFRSVRPHPLDEDGAGLDILVAPARGEVLLREPADLPAPDPLLVERSWTVTSIGGRPVQPGSRLTLLLAADLRANGFGGCNDYFAEARLEGSVIAFGPPATTRKACERAAAAQEAEFFAALAAVVGYETAPGALRLLDAAGVPLIGLVTTQEP